MVSELNHLRAGTFRVMGANVAKRITLVLVLAGGGLAAGCGSKTASVTAPLVTDADFSVCAGTKAVRYVSGMSVLSASGAYRVAIEAAATAGATAAVPAIGYDTFTVAVTSVSDGGAGSDAGTLPPDGLMMTPPPISPSVPADPFMPVHGHGASTVPTITAEGGGQFSVAEIDFFMGGYWQLYLDVTPPSGGADEVTFDLCIPDD